MKRLLTIMFVVVVMCAQAQHYEILHVEDENFNGMHFYCFDDAVSGLIIFGETDCGAHWFVTTHGGYDFPFEFNNMDSIVLPNPHNGGVWFEIQYDGCEINTVTVVNITNPPLNPFTESIVWARENGYESVSLDAGYWGESYLWSTGETNQTIVVTEPGVYSVTITNDCGSATYSVEVRDNVELYRATVDLRTNKNKVTWLATPEQAEYITEVKVYRDGNLVGTAPYANGYFLDAIGSDAAARTYQIVGVSVEGEDCPIASYQKGTIHTTYYLDVNNDLNMTWNAPYIQEEAEGQLIGYQIYKYDPATEELTLIDEVNTTITNYTCSANAFVGGRAILAATFDRVSPPSGGDGQRPEGAETRSFSNLSENMFAVGEETMANFKVYPNPAKGAFTVEGAKEVAVYNTLGQAVATSHSEEETHSFSLPSGVYFIKADERVKKMVVE